MRRPLALTALLLAVAAVAEIAVLVLVARWVGAPPTVLLVLATSALGVVLLRREGVRAWRRFRQAFEAGEPPGVRVADGLVGLVGALLLVVPGIVTDVLGLLLVAPPTRALARRAVQRVAEARMSSRLAGDVFGPRRVRLRRARRGTPAPPPVPPPVPPVAGRPAPGPPPPQADPGRSGPGRSEPGRAGPPGEDVIEGEIVEPGDRP